MPQVLITVVASSLKVSQIGRVPHSSSSRTIQG
jgi:hypothetical protein